jgi:hypothetical protein
MLKAWLDFASRFVWPLVLLGCFLYLRRQFRDLLPRVSQFKFAGVEILLQKELAEIGLGGFYTQDAITSIVERSGVCEPSEKIRHTLPLFQTERQRTWLAASDRRLFCVLDDEKKRSSGNLIQWVLPHERIIPIVARPGDRIGTVDIGEREKWLYSSRLHSPDELPGKIEKLFAS